MTLDLRFGLPFVPIRLEHDDRAVALTSVLLDTGSCASIFKTETLAELGAELSPTDPVVSMRGVGGVEYVVQKAIDRVIIGEAILSNPIVQLGSVDYGYGIDGIIGMDLLVALGADINLASLTLTFSRFP